MSCVTCRSGREVPASRVLCQGLSLSLAMVSGGGMVTAEDRCGKENTCRGIRAAYRYRYRCDPLELELNTQGMEVAPRMIDRMC